MVTFKDRTVLSSFVVGFIFAIGLGISGMTQPAKVIGFLDVFGNWDPALIFVMGGAVGVHMLTYRLIRKRKTPLFSAKWYVPNRSELTPSLMIGSALFGIGWGLGGYCPGPALTSLGSLSIKPFLFVISMFIGMYAYRLFDKAVKVRR